MNSYQKHFDICLGQGWPQRKKCFQPTLSIFLRVKWSYYSVGIIPDSKVVGEEQVIKIPREQVITFFFLAFSGVCLPLGRFFHLQPVGASSASRGFPPASQNPCPYPTVSLAQSKLCLYAEAAFLSKYSCPPRAESRQTFSRVFAKFRNAQTCQEGLCSAVSPRSPLCTVLGSPCTGPTDCTATGE